MPELDVFEYRLGRAVEAFADRAYTGVDPAAVTRAVAGRDERAGRRMALPSLAPSWGLLLAVGLLVAVLAAALLIGTRPRDLVTDPGDILATTVAGPTPTQANCPTGSDPDRVGPSAQARPPAPDMEDKAMAFDRHAGRIVLLADTPMDGSKTWTLDVCDNTWRRMAPPVQPPGGRAWLTYDLDSDRTVALVETEVGPDRRFETWVYDLGADRWSRGTAPPSTSVVPYESDVVIHFGLMYHDPSGLVVFHDAVHLWAYDLRSDAWTEVRQRPDPAKAPAAGVPGALMILAYDSLAGVFVAYARDGAADPDPWTQGTWLFDPRTGTWQDVRSVTPALRLGWDLNGKGGAVYDPVFDETAFFAGGGDRVHVLAADRVWHDGRRSAEPWLCLANTAVYDSINHRVVCRTEGDGVAFMAHSSWPTEDWVRTTYQVLLEPQASAIPAP